MCMGQISHNEPFCNRNVHISVTKWFIVGYGTVHCGVSATDLLLVMQNNLYGDFHCTNHLIVMSCSQVEFNEHSYCNLVYYWHNVVALEFQESWALVMFFCCLLGWFGFRIGYLICDLFAVNMTRWWCPILIRGCRRGGVCYSVFNKI